MRLESATLASRSILASSCFKHFFGTFWPFSAKPTRSARERMSVHSYNVASDVAYLAYICWYCDASSLLSTAVVNVLHV